MHALSSRLALTARLLFQYGGGLGYFSDMASGSVTIPTWRRTRALSFGPTNYEQCLHLSEWVSETFAYRSPRNKHVSTLRVATSLKIDMGDLPLFRRAYIGPALLTFSHNFSSR